MSYPVREVRHISGHVFTFTALDDRAFHSGRQLFRVWCQTCQQIVHDGTTGPYYTANYHVRTGPHMEG